MGNAKDTTGRKLMAERTMELSLQVIRLVTALPRGSVADVIGHQILRSGTSVGANYRAACRARSQREFMAKMGIVEEETDETLHWLSVMVEAQVASPSQVGPIIENADAILRMTVASINTARGGRRPASTGNAAIGGPAVLEANQGQS